nr:MAG TPA: hypothetical protein [Caudoviricetes sp.]
MISEHDSKLFISCNFKLFDKSINIRFAIKINVVYVISFIFCHIFVPPKNCLFPLPYVYILHPKGCNVKGKCKKINKIDLKKKTIEDI